MEFRYGHGDRPVAGYTILRAVGRGGFGEVYFAVSDGGREVALKRLVEHAEIELRGVRRCINVKSPHLVSVFDIVTGEDGCSYLIMEYVAGPLLREVLAENPRGLGTEKTAAYCHGIAAGLACLHARSIVHRDLKPENIFLEEGCLKIGDYGLAKHINVSRPGQQTMHLGTVHYMAPEIATGTYDHRVDIYALGILLFEMLAGEPPFVGNDLYEVALKHVGAAADLAKLPERFRPVVARALAKNPSERPATVEAMAREIQAAAAISPAPAPARRGARSPSPAAQRPRPTVFSGEGSAGRWAMAAIAAAGMAFALSLATPGSMAASPAPDGRGQAGEAALASAAAMINPVVLPAFAAIMAGTALAGSIALWFANRTGAGLCSGALCRLLVAAAGAAVWAGVLCLSGGLGRVPGVAGGGTVVAIFAGLALVNWLQVASLERNVRVGLGPAVFAGAVGWAASLFADCPGAVPSGILAGIALCVGFLAPVCEDLGLAREPERRRRALAAAPTQELGHAAASVKGVARPRTRRSTDQPSGEAWRGLGWFLVLLPLLLLFLTVSQAIVASGIVLVGFALRGAGASWRRHVSSVREREGDSLEVNAL